MTPSELSRSVKAKALELGFDLCGVAPAQAPPHAGNLDGWLAKGFAGSLGYLARHRDELLDPGRLLPDARSVLCCAIRYRPGPDLWPLVGKHPVSCYAWGRDYHDVLEEKLAALAAFVGEAVPGAHTRTCVDSGPILEKPMAVLAGLGCAGKNSLLLNREHGSLLFLGEVLTDANLAPDASDPEDLCGECRLCLDACPTGAIVSPGVLDARKCASYRTQRKDPLPQEPDALHGMLWGCDLCQKACPWNEKAPPGREESFRPWPEILALTPERVLSTPEAALKKELEGTPLASAKPGILRRNAEHVLQRK